MKQLKALLLLFFFVFLPSLIDGGGGGGEDDGGGGGNEDDANDVIDFIPGLTGFDCDFGPEEDCLWDWEKDNFTEGPGRHLNQAYPGQYGFYRLNGQLVQKYYNMTLDKDVEFFGPQQDRFNSEKGKT